MLQTRAIAAQAARLEGAAQPAAASAALSRALLLLAPTHESEGAPSATAVFQNLLEPLLPQHSALLAPVMPLVAAAVARLTAEAAEAGKEDRRRCLLYTSDAADE